MVKIKAIEITKDDSINVGGTWWQVSSAHAGPSWIIVYYDEARRSLFFNEDDLVEVTRKSFEYDFAYEEYIDYFAYREDVIPYGYPIGEAWFDSVKRLMEKIDRLGYKVVPKSD